MPRCVLLCVFCHCVYVWVLAVHADKAALGDDEAVQQSCGVIGSSRSMGSGVIDIHVWPCDWHIDLHTGALIL